MAGKIQHNFHGKLEQVQTADLPELTTTMIESIEIIVFVLLIFTVFFKFKNLISVNNYRKTPQNAGPIGNDGEDQKSISIPHPSNLS